MNSANHENHEHTESIALGGGKRWTKARTEISAVLNQARKPLKIQDIVRSVTANEASVYRTVRMLESEGILIPIRYPDGTTRYERASHHHHIICTGCGFTEHLGCSVPSVPSVESSRFVAITGHEITYHGRCSTCGS